MFEIAGGILLAVFIIALLPAISFVMAAIIVGGLVILLALLASRNILIALVLCLIGYAIYDYSKRKKIASADAEILFNQLQVGYKLSQIYQKSGELLISASNRTKWEDGRIIHLLHFDLKVTFNFLMGKFYLTVKRRGASLPKSISAVGLDGEWHRMASYLTADEIFLLNDDLETYIRQRLNEDIKAWMFNSPIGFGFFEDAKRIENGNSRVVISQHLISQSGVEATRPVLCNGQIVADIKFDYQRAEANVYIDGERVACIKADKWNSLRSKGKIKFTSEQVE
jgi:hypothetical protein